MKLISCLGAILASSVLMGSDSIRDTTALQAGEKASGALIQTLGGEVKARIQNEGAVAAVTFCSQQAQTLTRKVSQTHGVDMKRVSLQQRSPLNRPTPEEIELMKAWNFKIAQGEQPTAHLVKNGSQGYTYYKPLVIANEACLKCHGNVDPASPLGQAIHTIYPQDRATGYKMGDLRGMVVVNIPE